MENIDYFINASREAIDKLLLGDVVQVSPARFTVYNRDVNFTRAVSPCLVALAMYGIWFLVVQAAYKIVINKSRE